MEVGRASLLLVVMLVLASLLHQAEGAQTTEEPNGKPNELRKVENSTVPEVETMELEPSEFALSDEEHDPDFDYDEDDMSVGR